MVYLFTAKALYCNGLASNRSLVNGGEVILRPRPARRLIKQTVFDDSMMTGVVVNLGLRFDDLHKSDIHPDAASLCLQKSHRGHC